MYKKVLLPVSGEEHGKRALAALRKAMEVSDGMIILLHVSDPIPQTVGGDARLELERDNNAHGQVLMAPVIEQLENAGKHFRALVEGGTPAETIVTVADREGADLIVMHTDGREDLKDFLVGSITERVMRNTGVDMLVIREEK